MTRHADCRHDFKGVALAGLATLEYTAGLRLYNLSLLKLGKYRENAKISRTIAIPSEVIIPVPHPLISPL